METTESLKKLKENLKELIENIDENVNSLYKIATYDQKTGLHNYRFFSELFEIEFEKAKRGNKLSLAIFDIDNFKEINTKIGHIKADYVLVKVARLLEKGLRKYDILARFGGEEFIVLLPGTNLKKARKVAERIRKFIEKEFKEKITISGGLTEYRERDSITKMKEKADMALLKAKQQGKNRVEVA